MFVKIGRDDWQCYINVAKIESLVKRLTTYAQPCLPTVVNTPGTFFVPPSPQAPQFEYFLTMTGQRPDCLNWNLSEEDYERVVRALEQGGGDLLFEG